MKKLLTLSLLLLCMAAHAQKYGNLADSTKVATLRGDTLFVHKPEQIEIKQQSTEERVLLWKGKRYNYRYAFYDELYFWAYQNKSVKVKIKHLY